MSYNPGNRPLFVAPRADVECIDRLEACLERSIPLAQSHCFEARFLSSVSYLLAVSAVYLFLLFAWHRQRHLCFEATSAAPRDCIVLSNRCLLALLPLPKP